MNSAADVPFTIRRAAPGDEGIIVAFLHELASFEGLAASFSLSEIKLRRDLFGDEPKAVCDLAFAENESAGIALWFRTYRSFRAEAGIFVEDLYVRPKFRGLGLGRALLRHLARQGRDRGARMEWRVLDWNGRAIAFYRGLGAVPLANWIVYRLEGEALESLAS